jgi:serine/alanine adding enzyme
LKEKGGGTLNIEIVNNMLENEWRRLVEDHSAGNIFHTPEMFQVFSRTKGYRPELWAATKEGRILALLLPVQITLMNGLFQSFTTRAVVYGSALCVPDTEGKEGLARLLQTYTYEVDGQCLFTELRNISNLETIQPILREHGFVYEDYLNYLINLNRSPEAVFENFGRRTRKNIRRGHKQGKVVVEEAKKRDQVNACYDLLCRSYREAHVPLADHSLFEGAFDLLYPKGLIRFTLARFDQTPIAASVELLYKDVIYGWYGGVDRKYSSYVPNELVMWEILKWGAENGYRVYDFGGAGSPDEEYGVRDFKAKFGGELVCYGRNIYIHAPLSLCLSKLGYRIFRRFL